MKKALMWVGILGLGVLLLGLVFAVEEGVGGSNMSNSNQTNHGEDGNEISGVGTIKFVDVEGGCWKIIRNDGVNYEPINLNDSYKQDGLLVKFEAELVNDSVSICMVGTLIKLKEIEKKQEGNDNDNNESNDDDSDRWENQTKEKNKLRAHSRNATNCPNNCTCTGSVTKCWINGTREMTVVAGNSGNIIFQVKGQNVSTTVELYKDENGTVIGVFKNKTKIIYLPDQVRDKIQERLMLKNCSDCINMTLDENGYYQLQTEKRARLFGLFPMKKMITIQVNAETGEITKTKTSWWGFLASDVNETNSTIEENSTLTNSS